jgi:hypothetical protein
VWKWSFQTCQTIKLIKGWHGWFEPFKLKEEPKTNLEAPFLLLVAKILYPNRPFMGKVVFPSFKPLGVFKTKIGKS